jgi:D-alanyl-D-alanine carboxypeptidase
MSLRFLAAVSVLTFGLFAWPPLGQDGQGSNQRVEAKEPAGSISALADRIDGIVEAARSKRQIPGVTLVVEHRGHLVVSRGYGEVDIENRVPASLDSVYPIASLTKQFTAAAILQLEERGKLRLDDELGRFIPELPVQMKTVTIHHLLSHTHGIPEYNRDETRAQWPTATTHDKILSLLRDHELDFKPGAQFRYRNSGYYLLGMIVERASGASYGEYLKSRMFEPLGMRDTRQCVVREIIPRRARGYDVENGRLRNADLLDPSWAFAVGDLCSTVLDLLQWQHALRGGKVITLASYKRMTTPDKLAEGKPTDYGYGLGISAIEGHKVVRHGGGTVGFASYMTFYPDDDLTIVLLTNSGSPNAPALEEEIAKMVFRVTA